MSFDQPTDEPDELERDHAAQELANRAAVERGELEAGTFDLSDEGITSEPRYKTEPFANVERVAHLRPARRFLPRVAASPVRRVVTFHRSDTLPLRAHDWLIDRYLERGALATLTGETGSYKSFLALDMAVCIAAGRDWHGRKVKQGAVFVVVGEGHDGIRRRVKAAIKARGIAGDVPLYFTERAHSLDDEDTPEGVIAAIRDTTAQTKQTVALVIVDTLARNFRGDENSTRDMGALVRAVARIRDETGAAVLLIHHVGHSAKDRERGAYSLGADMDYRYLLKRYGDTPTATLEVIKAKDDELPPPLQITLSAVPVGMKDEGGAEVSSLAVQSVTATTVAKADVKSKGRKSSTLRRKMLAAIKSAQTADGGASLDDVRQEFARAYAQTHEPASDPVEAKRLYESCKRTVRRLLGELKKAGQVTILDDVVTLTGE